MNIIKRKFKSWLSKLKRRLIKRPLKTMLLLIVSIAAIYLIAIELFKYLGLLPVTAYIIACIYGISEIIDKPIRTLYWALGYTLGAIALAVLIVYLIPSVQSGRDLASVTSALIILFITISLFKTSRKLKKK